MADEAARAERQARLSKALGAAYLSHQIEQLEDRVTSNLTLGGRGRGEGEDEEATVVEETVDVAEEINEDTHAETRLVLDTSALVFALPAITRLLRTGKAELIVPLETLRTLDLLKKGMHPYAVAARTATRFIETEQRRTRAGQGEGEVGDDGWRKIRPGLWIQRDHEQEHIGPASDETDVTTPPFIQSTLACALYFRKFWDLTSSQPVLAVAVPPEVKVPSEDPVARYAERADGRALREWADRGDVVVHVYGQRDESESDEDVPDVVDALVPPSGEDFVDQEEARIVTLTSPSDDPRARPSRRQPPVVPRAPLATADRVLKIFDAEKGMVPSTEVLAQRERERERELRNGRRGRGKPLVAIRPPREQAINAPSAPVLLRRAPVVPDWQPEQRERPPNAQWSRGRKDGFRGARSGRGGKPVNAVEEGPKVMLLQRPK
ncbi:hypothetical protein QFC20_003608 [Naganishia adeliensis]|uniref:Uncharacterized protein n=1 Tax=Naganishia adeliensis TaxID=92952 RepID=A0ACC2W8E8_9TREE|nr:hypothetical protein QFC20_003608 [Naganishia adeliensis]